MKSRTGTDRVSAVCRLGVIGCGLRSDCYLHAARHDLGKRWRLAALADPSPTALAVYRRNYSDSWGTQEFAGGPEMLQAIGDDLDGVIIASPNSRHLESMAPAVRRGLTVLLEKPVATTVEDCATMWRAWQETGRPPLAVGFVLRYTPFYRKVKELLDQGAVGQVLSIDATENLGPALTSMFTRQWRRFEKDAGPFLLEKCSHDMDLLNWLAGSPARRVSSFASRTRFVPRANAAARCRDCRLRDCRYDVKTIAPYLINGSRGQDIAPLLPSLDNDLCVFNSEKDVPDHQVVNIEYQNGVLATFSAVMDQPRTTRTIKVNGTMGQISGDIGLNRLRIERHLTAASETQEGAQEIPLQHDASGHHGGDSVIARQFFAMLAGDQTPPDAGLREGIEAAVLALAADASAKTGSMVDAGAVLDRVLPP